MARRCASEGSGNPEHRALFGSTVAILGRRAVQAVSSDGNFASMLIPIGLTLGLLTCRVGDSRLGIRRTLRCFVPPNVFVSGWHKTLNFGARIEDVAFAV